MLYTHVSVASLLNRYPWAHTVFEWHGVDPYTVDAQMSLDALCWLHRLDPFQIARDLVAASPEHAEEVSDLLYGEAANNNEQWEFDERSYAFDPWDDRQVAAWSS